MSCHLVAPALTDSWRRPTGVNYVGGVEVVEVLKETAKGVEFIVAPKHIASRGDTLNSEHGGEYS